MIFSSIIADILTHHLYHLTTTTQSTGTSGRAHGQVLNVPNKVGPVTFKGIAILTSNVVNNELGGFDFLRNNNIDIIVCNKHSKSTVSKLPISVWKFVESFRDARKQP